MKFKYETFLLLMLICLSGLGFFGAQAQNVGKADRIQGVYYVVEDESKEESKIKIGKSSNGSYYAQVVWMKNPNMPDGSPKRDPNNPDPNLRKGRADQIVIMSGLTYNESKEEWQNGKVYNPVNGKIYKSYMEFVGEKKLKVRGYLGLSMFGRTMYWQKLE